MAKIPFLLVALLQFFFFATSYGANEKGPPAGALIVKKQPGHGQFSKIQDAVNALPKDGSSQQIYIYGGSYEEQVTISHNGPLTILGVGDVTITHAQTIAQAKNDDATATLRVHMDNFKMRNVKVWNTAKWTSTNGQALALSTSGENQGYYDCAFHSHQDTIYLTGGTQYFGGCYIEGTVDYIFGSRGRTLFNRCTIVSIGPGAITAHGPRAGDNSIIVIQNSVIKAGTGGLTHKVYLGRPWTENAHVVYISCTLGDLIHPDGWSIWSKQEPHTGPNLKFIEYHSQGAGASSKRIWFAKVVNSPAGYDVNDVLGSNWQSLAESDDQDQ